MKRRLSMRFIIYVIGLLPLTVLMIISLIYTSIKMENAIHAEVEHKLEVTAKALHEYALENYELSGDFSYYHDYIDALAETEVDLTLIKDNTRFITTLRNEDGSRNEGTTIDNEIYNTLKSGGTYYSKDIQIGGKDYAVYYDPIFLNGEYVGAAFAGENIETIYNTVTTMKLGILTITLGVYIFFIILLTYVSYIISKPLKRASEALTEIANGDLKSEIAVKSILKETINIAEAAEKLNNELRGIVSAIREDTIKLNTSNAEFLQRFEEISTNVENVNTAVEEIAQGATSQANDTTNVAMQVSEMGGVVDSSNQEISNLQAIVERMNMVSAKADELLNNLVKLNDKAKESIEVVENQTKATNISAEKIREAIDVIQEIAEQTNLLSLNASIEAARAGEQGRGFAVVAGEIRNLANSSAESASVIEGIIKELMLNSNESVETMKEVLSNTGVEHEALLDTQSAFEKLKDEVTRVSEASQEIAQQMVKLNESRGLITDSTESLSAISEENAAATEETSASMQELNATIESCTTDIQVLNELSENLEKQVAIFQL